MKRSRVLSPGLLFLAAVGCVHAPPRETPELTVRAPEAWVNSAGQSLELTTENWNWLDGFEAPGLKQAVDQALRHNLDLRAAEARLTAAAAQARVAGADLKPTAEVGLNRARRRQNFIGFPIPGSTGVLSTESTSLGLTLATHWEIDLWGRIRAGAAATIAEYQASAADLEAARLSIGGQTAKAWFDWLESERQFVLAVERTDNKKEIERYITRRYREGLLGALDLNDAAADTARAAARQELFAARRTAARQRLQQLLGEYPAGDAGTIAALPNLPTTIPGVLPASLIARRPDLVAAERRLAAAGARYREARRSLYPRISLSASGGTTSDALSNLLDGDFRVWSILTNLTQPLFQGGRLRAGVDASRAVVHATLFDFASSALTAFSEIESTLDQEARFAARARALRSALEETIASRDLSERRYRAGVGDRLAVLSASQAVLVTEGEWLTSQRSRLVNRVNLLLALGGGWQAEDLTP